MHKKKGPDTAKFLTILKWILIFFKIFVFIGLRKVLGERLTLEETLDKSYQSCQEFEAILYLLNLDLLFFWILDLLLLMYVLVFLFVFQLTN